MSSTAAAILHRAVDGERLSSDDGVELFRSASLLELGRAADSVCRRLHPEPFRTYNIDRNINYTNVCTAVCDFCAFYRKVDDTEAYVLDRDVLLEKIRETVALGGDQILMQGGLHPHLKLEWYEELLAGHQGPLPRRERSRVQCARDSSLHQGSEAAARGSARAAQGGGAG